MSSKEHPGSSHDEEDILMSLDIDMFIDRVAEKSNLTDKMVDVWVFFRSACNLQFFVNIPIKLCIYIANHYSTMGCVVQIPVVCRLRDLCTIETFSRAEVPEHTTGI